MKLIDWYSTYRSRVLNRILDTFGSDIDINKANKDPHAKRKLRPCGLTVHTGVGCPLSCIYCYIYDMGFNHEIKTYPLNPETLIYSIALNPYLLLGPYGTFLALGSVTEPFLNKIKNYTIKLIKLIREYLKNPTQISVKMVINDDDISKLYNSDPNLSILYTLVAFNTLKKLEPSSPSINDRMEFLSKLIKYGFKPTLFIRPIIPGITDKEINLILKHAWDIGITSVVFGSLRVTNNILRKFYAFPSVYQAIMSRITRMPRGREQIPIRTRDLKLRLESIAINYGFIVFPSACAANVYTHNLSCYMCKFGPCGDRDKLPHIEEMEILEFLDWLNVKHANIAYYNDKIEIKISGYTKQISNYTKSIIKSVVSYAFKRQVYIT